MSVLRNSPALLGFALLAACVQTPSTDAAAPVPAGAADEALTPEDRLAFFVDNARNGANDELAKALAAGVPANDFDTLDQTALIAAVAHNHVDTVKLLLDHGADPKLADHAGWTPLIHSTYFGGSDELLNLLIDRGADVNARNDRGVTALYLASATGHEAQVALLLKRGADAAIASKSGYTALRVARQRGLTRIAALLQGQNPETASAEPLKPPATATP